MGVIYSSATAQQHLTPIPRTDNTGQETSIQESKSLLNVTHGSSDYEQAR